MRSSTVFCALGAIALTTVGLAGCTSDDGASTPTPTEDTTVDAVDLEVGMCILDSTAAAAVTSVEVVDCDDPHDAEVYASLVLTDGTFPGEEAIAVTSQQQCETQFANFVGVAFGTSTLTYKYFAPTAQTWAAGDREVLCLILDPAGPVSGSLEDAAR